MASARTLEDVLASIEEQRLADEERRAADRPTPWFNLLRHPSGAAWRSSDRVLGSSAEIDVDDDDDAEDDVVDDGDGGGSKGRNARRTSVLSRTQFNLLRRSERTNKQLRRTYRRILEVQKALSIKRERERRLAANSVPAPSSRVDDGDDGNGNGNGNDGGATTRRRLKRQSIEDGRGRRVGDWREKGKGDAAPAPSSPYCEDPSVALSLSIGLKSVSASAARKMKKNATNNNDGGGPDDDRDGMGGGLNATDYYYADNMATASAIPKTNAKSAKARLAKSGYAGDASSAASRRPVAYGPEQAMTNLKYRLGSNYSIVRRVLVEVQSLLGGGGGGGDGGIDKHGGRRSFRPRRVLDFGSGVGSSGAAALDVFGVGRSMSGGGGGRTKTDDDADDGIDWIHSIDASQCMRETTEKVLKSVLEGSPWENEGGVRGDNSEEEEELMLAEYERLLFDDGGSKNRELRRLERRRRRMERWEQTWQKRTDARTRLTFGESIVDASSAVPTTSPTSTMMMNGGRDDDHSDGEGIDDNNNNRRRLPWQEQLDEQRRRTAEEKRQGQKQQHRQQKNKGSFDLILCSYTLSELPSVPASLAAATLLWEKLAPNGVLVFVEPGTPDGFGMLRSVRSMLLECCSPPEVKERRKRNMAAATAAMKQSMAEKETGDDEIHDVSDEPSLSSDGNDDNDDDNDDDNWPEECHVIAPCTHNGTCPMSRHQRNHVKRNTRFAKYEAAEPKEEVEGNRTGEDEIEGGNDEEEEGSFQDLLDEWDDMTEGQKEELKMMLGGGEDMSDDEAKAMLEYMESMDSDEENEEDEDDEDNVQDSTSVDSDDDYDDDDVGDDQEYYNIEEGANHNEPSSKKSSIIAKTDVFGTSFCSFVHNFPGGTTRKRGEKFTYLVVQKRLMNDEHDRVASNATAAPSRHPESLDEVDIVEMLSKSIHHAQKLKREQLQKRLRQRRYGADVDDGQEEETPAHSYHKDQSQYLLRKAVEVEDQFLKSTMDSLGLEMLHGDERRRGWGRLIRAPLKKRGHVLLDYCSAGCGGGNGGCSRNGSTDEDDDLATTDGHDLPDGTQGRITRHKVSRGWSARSAPGCYSAARKARWGGLWPDLSERVKRIEREDERAITNDSNC
jgi:ribosomal protein RSM22 (predicted rRNA methylase)